MEEIRDINDFDFDGIEFKFGKKVRKLRLTLPGLKLLSKYFGSVDKAFMELDKLREKDKKDIMDENFLNTIGKLTHACAMYEDPNVTLEEIENQIDFYNLMKLMSIVTNVIKGSMPEPKEVSETVGESKTENQPKSTLTSSNITQESNGNLQKKKETI